MKKVVIGLSGGVDSAVAALLLKKQGYIVKGVFMRNWDSVLNNDILGNTFINDNVCPQEADYMDALLTSKELDIEFERVDFVEEYWNRVFLKFKESYEKGKTPNPDILCNNEIKFKCFLEYALNKDIDYISTGHYAKIIKNEDNNLHLYKAFDKEKDQSYFLSGLTKEQLSRVLFPLGDITKIEVRKIALDNNLTVALKKDSTGICFIGERKFKEFLKNYISPKEGEMRRLDNSFVKKHSGVYYYTIGQRHGLDIGGKGEAWFVVGKDIANNILYVEQGDNKYLYGDSLIINNINKLQIHNYDNLYGKFRYRSTDVKCSIDYIDTKSAKVILSKEIKALTPGQQAVFYHNDELVMSGEIDSVYYKNERRLY